MSLFFCFEIRFSIWGISKYPIENEYFFLFWKINLAARSSKLMAFGRVLNGN